ncbi:hypothetical protein C8R45DRAFT_1099418 [Mycena sanguinolenta]|nr:hypothetical protein C8R45DRAFT_1099418 [Mycena sanguinolenta]
MCEPKDWEKDHHSEAHLKHHCKQYHNPDVRSKRFPENCKAYQRNPSAKGRHIFRCPFPARCEPEKVAVPAPSNDDDDDDDAPPIMLSNKHWRSKINLLRHILKEHCQGEITKDIENCFQAVVDAAKPTKHRGKKEITDEDEDKGEEGEDNEDDDEDNPEDDPLSCDECRHDPSLTLQQWNFHYADPSKLSTHMQGKFHCQKLGIEHPSLPPNVLAIYEALRDILDATTSSCLSDDECTAALNNLFKNWGAFPTTLNDLYFLWYDVLEAVVVQWGEDGMLIDTVSSGDDFVAAEQDAWGPFEMDF